MKIDNETYERIESLYDDAVYYIEKTAEELDRILEEAKEISPILYEAFDDTFIGLSRMHMYNWQRIKNAMIRMEEEKDE